MAVPKNSASRPARVVMSQADIDRVLTRIAHEIIETNRGTDSLILLGIPRRGMPLASQLATKISGIDPQFSPEERTGQLDITMYRDDLSRAGSRLPAVTKIPDGGVDSKTVILVDDVLYSGRTIRAALDAISDNGRPSAVRLAVLVDRGHRQLPIRADYVGKNLPTSVSERVSVVLRDIDGEDNPDIEDAVIISDMEENQA